MDQNKQVGEIGLNTQILKEVIKNWGWEESG